MAIGANLSKRDQSLVAVAVVSFLIAGLYGYLIWKPKRDELNAIQEHVDTLDRKNQQAKADLASGSVAKLKAQAAEYRASLTLLQQLVPTTNEVPALLENVSTAARRVGLDLASVEPMPVLNGEMFDTYRYKLSVKGGYHALAGFLANVGSLNRIIAPVALDVKAQSPADMKKNPPRNGESGLDTDFQIQTYIAHSTNATAPEAPAGENKP